MRVAVIGAGIAGLSAAKNSIQNGFDVVVYEQSENIGGTWVYTDDIGTTKFGIDVHSSMYKGLHTNLPKEIMGYPDFPIPEQNLSYIPAHDILAFLNAYAVHFNVTNKIRFHHYVIRVRPYQDSKWEIIVKDFNTDEIRTEIFDAIFVCNGHYHSPAWPEYPGNELFEGRQIHSHDYRCAEPFKDETVLVVGAGPSGMDLAYEISKVAQRVTLSHHLTEKPRTVFPDNVRQTTDVVEISAKGVRFSDGSYEEFSLIFYCTGYKYMFPFLSVDCGISVDDNYVKPLYKHCLNINKPTMAIIGLPFYVCATQMMDLQVRFCLQYLTGKKTLPSRQEMRADTEKEMQKRWDRGFKKRQAHMMGEDQNKYYDDLSATAGIENLKPVITKLHNESSQNFLHDLLNFRQDRFRIIDDETFIRVN